jgi:hypothetical protein
MMIARAVGPDGEFLLLGLSRSNIQRLMAGEEILISDKTHQGVPEGMTIGIIFGETELHMKAKLEHEGIVGPETQVYVDPRLK